MLKEIIAHKRLEVAQREEKKPLAVVKSQCKPSNRSLAEALSRSGTHFICEIKKASPSLGPIRPKAQVLEVAQIYAPFASAISVLTDSRFFDGSLDYLKQVSDNVSCPILAKDFFISPYQVYEARTFGANAILLMLSVLSDAEYRSLSEVASSLSLDVLTEVHNEEELVRAIHLKASLIGINNRNLNNLKVDTNTCLNLVEKIPSGRIIVAESGYGRHEEILQARDAVNAFLVGTALMKQERMDLGVRELVFGRVKICGLTSEEDALTAYQMGATFGGLNFSLQSKRNVSVSKAQDIVRSAPLIWGGVFVNQSLEEVKDIASTLDLSFIQLHGDEDPKYVLDLRKRIKNGVEIWKAIPVQAELPRENIWRAERLLFDGFHKDLRGGTGQSFDWAMLRDYPEKKQIILAGGLSPKNIDEASRLEPFALDVASGVEESPGKKSRAKMAELFSILKNGQERA